MNRIEQIGLRSRVIPIRWFTLVTYSLKQYAEDPEYRAVVDARLAQAKAEDAVLNGA